MTENRDTQQIQNLVEAESVAAAEAKEAEAAKVANEKAITKENMPDLIIITGISGAGRTEAMHVFEDLGYFCIDNLPATLLSSVMQVKKPVKDSVYEKDKIAVVCDARNREFFGSLKQEIEKLEKMGINYKIVFLDASDDKLIARYKSSRRRHPMCEGGETIAQGIQKERDMLFEMHEAAHYVIDTTDMMPQALRSTITTMFKVDNQREGLNITVYSFGFKNGAAVDADVVIDVRFLPNPYWDPDLRQLSGLDAPVHDFVMARSETEDFLKRWYSLLDCLIPGYVKEGKQQLAIAIGCTGGQHRSVTITEATSDYLKSKSYRVSVAHRDLAMAVAQASGKDFYTSPGMTSPGLSGRIPRITAPGKSGAWRPV